MFEFHSAAFRRCDDVTRRIGATRIGRGIDDDDITANLRAGDVSFRPCVTALRQCNNVLSNVTRARRSRAGNNIATDYDKRHDEILKMSLIALILR